MVLLRAGLLCLLLLQVMPAKAEQQLHLVANTWPPFNDISLPYNGVATDIVVSALARAGYATRYSEVPWARAIQGVERGIYDVLINAWYSQPRTAFGDFSKPYMVNRVQFVKRRDAAINYQRLSDLYPYRIATIRGYTYTPAFDNDPQINRVEVVSFAIAARMLHAGRVELAVEDEIVVRYHLNRSLADIKEDLQFLSRPLSENGLHILVSLKHPQHRQIAQQFDEAIAAMKRDGSYERILKRHGL
ncbi:transporter substrate-binding domain-containing protein [Ectopseudomonas mendocina]|uniref:Transporter substrate-binding domain-containing protein n=1 Tax=Ectopseudomonas mendocina TaxID=300 RepID=A0ABZ2RH09_ECTME